MIADIYQPNSITFETFVLNFIDLFSNWALAHYYNSQENEENCKLEILSTAVLRSDSITLRKLLEHKDFF